MSKRLFSVAILLFVFAASEPAQAKVDIFFAGIGTASLHEKITPENEILDIVRSDKNRDKIDEAIANLLKKVANLNDSLEISYFSNAVNAPEEQIKTVDYDETGHMVALLSVDKVMMFEELVELNNQILPKRTAYIAMSFYLVQAKSQKMVFCRPFVIPWQILPGKKIANYADYIIDSIVSFFSDRQYSADTMKIMATCIGRREFVRSDYQESFSVAEVELAKSAKDSFQNDTLVKDIAIYIANASLAQKYLVVPAPHQKDSLDDSIQFSCITYNFRPEKDIEDEGRDNNHLEDNTFHITIKLPQPSAPLKFTIKTQSKILEDNKYFQKVGYMAGAYFQYNADTYKCVDAVTSIPSKQRTSSSDVQYYNALINAVSKLEGGIDACQKLN